MTSLADKAILFGADNRPPMLEKDMYDSWKSRMELYILNRQHGRMILESVENGPLLWPTVEDNGGESLRDFYLRFSLLLNDMNIYSMKLEQFQVNTKFLNNLHPEWSKFVTDVKLSSQYGSPYHSLQYASQAQSSTPLSITYPSNDFQSSVHHNVYNTSSSIPQVEYAPSVHQQSDFSQPNTGLVVPVFQKGDDPIDAINHMMSFLTAFVTSRYPLTNNQLRNSSNPREQAIINNGRVTIQPIQGRQNSSTAGMSRQYTSGPSGTTSEKQKVIVCYNCKGEGHLSKQCIKPKRKRDEIQGQQRLKAHNFSHYGSDNLVEVHNQDNVTNNVIDQDVQTISTSEQSNIMNQSETEFTSDSNIISYSQCLNESQYTTINQDNKNVNEILTAELERYKDQVRILKEQNNVDKASESCAQSLEIDNLKHTLSKHFKENESLEQMAQQLEPKLYDGSVIQKTDAIVIRDSEETLMLEDESRSKMLQKQKRSNDAEKKVNTKPNSGNSAESNLSTTTTIVEVPKELPKVSMVNSSLKKLKFHLASFDMVVKERTTATTITEGTWGFEHTKDCFRDEIIPFVKALKELFNLFDQFLIDELTEVQNIFNQMEQAFEQHYVEKNNFQDKMKDVLKENERLLEQAISTDIVNIVVNANVVQIVLWYLDSGCSKHITGDRSLLINFVQKFLGIVKFRNDHVAKIMGYGDYKIGNVTILRVYFVEGLGHNLFSVGQFCDSDLEVAFCQHICFIRNLDGGYLLTGSRGNNIYTLSLGDMMASSPICLLSKASKTKSWLWHHRLSHLNFGVINHLARKGLVRGLPKLKFKKDHLCSACAMGKSKKKSHKPKSEDTNQEKLYLLHMDLCGPMRVKSVNEKKYILVIVNDYSRFIWVKCLRSNDKALDFIIKFLKMIQIRIKVGISHETLVARSPQQNGIVERRNRMLTEATTLWKLQPKGDIGIFIGYVPTKKAFWIYNRRTRRIVKTIHVDFDELTAMASEQSSSKPALNDMTPATISSGLVPKSSSSTPYVPPSRNDWDLLFQPLFDELLTHPPSIDPPAPEVIALIANVILPVHAESTGSLSLTTVDQDAPSPSKSQTTPET
nr:retrovirus-related Pol polyprotein from transposon TNT 1-94 [Tanacetum cinerariifolium]